jgi:hypothetical protein
MESSSLAVRPFSGVATWAVSPEPIGASSADSPLAAVERLNKPQIRQQIAAFLRARCGFQLQGLGILNLKGLVI